ncbi:hypothetical protein [Roseovarius indicus]
MLDLFRQRGRAAQLVRKLIALVNAKDLHASAMRPWRRTTRLNHEPG